MKILNFSSTKLSSSEINQSFKLNFEKDDVSKKSLFAPDGLLSIIYLRSGSLTVIHGDENHFYKGPTLLFSLYTEPQYVIAHEPCAVYGMTVQPNFEYEICKYLIDIRDRFVSYYDINLGEAKILMDMLGDEMTEDHIISRLSSHVCSRLLTGDNYRAKNVYAIAGLIQKHQGAITVNDIEEYFGKPLRTMQAQFKSYMGLTMKQYIDLYRFNAVKTKLNTGLVASLTELAYDHGYYDQSHFIKHFKRYTNLSPSQYVINNDQMAHHFHYVNI